MNEFELIEQIVADLGASACAPWVRVGPGDDAAVIAVPAGMELVATIDAIVADVHFPATAGAALIGYRAVMVSASDLAAMGAEGGYLLVALNLPQGDPAWVAGLTRGMAEASAAIGVPIVGGNLAAGPLSITVAAQGFVPAGQALLRSGAEPGDGVYVTGELGAAAAALARGGLGQCASVADLDPLSARYFRPMARMDVGRALRGLARSAIDVSDGLLQDLGHLCDASGVGVALDSAAVPVAAGATLQQALTGGDDYELCFTLPPGAEARLPALDVALHRIGEATAERGVWLDGRQIPAGGYQHFHS
ncbi:MAG: thiamine-phosphate kinase [Pseudomonadales bacterium]